MPGGSAYELISSMPRDEFHRDQLVEALVQGGYSRPDDRIASLVKCGAVVKVARGWYATGNAFRRRSLHLRWLSNIMYASCLSLNYALWHWGLIPEHVEALTAITPLRKAGFNTDIGRFLYTRVPNAAFSMGRTIAVVKDTAGGDERFFITVPEKALADVIWADRRVSPSTGWDEYLFEDLRIDESFIRGVSASMMLGFAEAYGSRKLASLASWFEERG
ncbi:MAG: hypothetical protein STSR0007_12080 [Thermovirga sp.]